jgi:hypothetical protein
MQIESVRTAARAIARSVGVVGSTFGGLVRTKRCAKCRQLLAKRAIVCARCGRWQG